MLKNHNSVTTPLQVNLKVLQGCGHKKADEKCLSMISSLLFLIQQLNQILCLQQVFSRDSCKILVNFI